MHEDDDEHAGFDAAQLREHEEFTKVKNVAKIELGRYEMETWYFSPLPDEFKGCTVSAQALNSEPLPPQHQQRATIARAAKLECL